jgi:hypothetical protein
MHFGVNYESRGVVLRSPRTVKWRRLVLPLYAALIFSCQMCRKEAAFISLHELYRHLASRKGISLGCSSSRIADFKLPDMQEGSGLTRRNCGMMAPQCISVIRISGSCSPFATNGKVAPARAPICAALQDRKSFGHRCGGNCESTAPERPRFRCPMAHGCNTDHPVSICV